jgi:hypothetical protein
MVSTVKMQQVQIVDGHYELDGKRVDLVKWGAPQTFFKQNGFHVGLEDIARAAGRQYKFFCVVPAGDISVNRYNISSLAATPSAVVDINERTYTIKFLGFDE